MTLEFSAEDTAAINEIVLSLSDRSKRPLSLNHLLAAWATFVEKVEVGYADSIYEYTNDLSSRDLLGELLARAPGAAKAKLAAFIKPWDERFDRGTRTTVVPIAPGVSKSEASWWFRVPRILSGELEADLHSQGIY